MAVAGFMLRISKQDYQDKLSLIEGQMDELNSILSEYHTLMGQLEDVMERTSDDFAKTEANVMQNIEAVQTSLKQATNARDAVQASLNAFVELGERAASTLNSAGEMAESATKAAIKTASVLN